MNAPLKRCLPGMLSILVLVLAATGCTKKKRTAPPPASNSEETTGSMKLCNFAAGPKTAPVKVVAFYPGRHQDTLAAVKSLINTFPGKVRVEIVDWRTEDGLKRRDAAGLSCAGVVINGKNAFDLVENGKKVKVLFVRGIDGEWTKKDLEAAVRQVLDETKRSNP